MLESVLLDSSLGYLVSQTKPLQQPLDHSPIRHTNHSVPTLRLSLPELLLANSLSPTSNRLLAYLDCPSLCRLFSALFSLKRAQISPTIAMLFSSHLAGRVQAGPLTPADLSLLYGLHPKLSPSFPKPVISVDWNNDLHRSTLQLLYPHPEDPVYHHATSALAILRREYSLDYRQGMMSILLALLALGTGVEPAAAVFGRVYTSLGYSLWLKDIDAQKSCLIELVLALLQQDGRPVVQHLLQDEFEGRLLLRNAVYRFIATLFSEYLSPSEVCYN